MIAITRPSANQVAEQLTGRNYISHSAISTYQQCPLRYYFKYVAGLPEETVSASLIFGAAVHRAVEFHFRELLCGNPAPDLDALVAEYQRGWNERGEQRIQFGSQEDQATLVVLARRMLSAFKQCELATPKGIILGVEEELRGPLVPGCPDLLARVDLLVETADALVVTDLKTARSRWSQDQVDGSAGQLLLYSELVSNLAPGKPIKLEFSVITKAKVPLVDCHEVPVSPHQVRRTRSVVQQVWQAIEAGHFYPAPSPMNCPTCPFRQPCRTWTG
jgi:CRISPR/Cas system-associated exonuclease Cas4 (RecB family)